MVMLNGRGVSRFGTVGGVASVLGVAFALGGCGGSKSLGEVTGGAGGTGATGGAELGGTSNGGFEETGGASMGGTSTSGGGHGPRDYQLDGIGGYYNPAVQDTAEGKLDLLFVVDNSISMADKQELLSEAVPQMVGRFINPRCVDGTGQPVSEQPETGDEPCPSGSVRELSPVKDMHVGVITSSLGGHGGIVCSPDAPIDYEPEKNDRGELIAPLRGLPSYEGQGFLRFDADGAGSVSDPDAFLSSVRGVIEAAGERGCGYEATLESWYRFLIDPEPPATVVKDQGFTEKQGINGVILQQREDFLRPDSSVAIVLLSDENDCSVRDEGVGWLLGTVDPPIPRGTSVCLDDPNDPCCRSCALAETEPPAGCESLDEDSHCSLGEYQPSEEHLNLRCWEQRRRFGIDFLYNTDRYVRALTHDTVFRDSDNAEVENPLFAGGQRDPSMVSLVGIVGVPWQALARSMSEEVPLRYKPAMQLHSEGAWSVLGGEPAQFLPPQDPFMVESVEPRTGTSPITGLSPEPSTSVADASPINGHEYAIVEGDDLQYACVFPLMNPRDCTTYEGGCDCSDLIVGLGQRPLCQAPGSSAGGTTQYWAKAYPGLRHLEVMRRVGPLAVPASICPRVAADTNDPEFGYAPVVEAMIDRMKQTLE